MKNIRTKTVKIDEYHSIEFKPSAWNPNKMSIRNRYDRDKGFNYASSSELSFEDLARMTVESAKHDAFDADTALEIAKSLLDSIGRVK